MEENQSIVYTERTNSDLREIKCSQGVNQIMTTSESVKAIKGKHESCPVCECRFDPNLHDHPKNKRMYVCGICRKSFVIAKDLKKHFNAHLHDYPYICDVCNSGFQTFGTMNIHKRSQHGSDTNVGEKSSLKSFECTECDKKFSSKSNLSSHQRVHSEKRPHHCTDCTRSFKTQSELKSHKLIHTNEKPFVCPICHKGFRQSGNLSSHIRVHNEERPFICNICGNAFRESSKLKRHHRLHTQEKPYACSECGRSFRDYSNMKKHLRTHFKEPLLLKSKTDSIVKNENTEVINEEENQQDTDVEQNTYICNICGISFLEMVLAQIHVKSHRGEEGKLSETDTLEMSNSP